MTTNVLQLTNAISDRNVGGFDVKKEMHEIHNVLGVCPQFDILWDDLTVKEHLLLYARIKGVRDERVCVRRVAEAVRLRTRLNNIE